MLGDDFVAAAEFATQHLLDFSRVVRLPATFSFGCQRSLIVPLLTCPSCHGSLNVESLQEIPAWCSKCGADLPRDPSAYFKEETESSMPVFQEARSQVRSFEEAFAEPELLQSMPSKPEPKPTPTPDDPPDRVALQVQEVLRSAGLPNETASVTTSEHAIDSDDRFSKHNLRVGLLLAFWGVGASLFLGAGGGSGHESIDSTADFLQMLMVFSGIALFVSGLGIREGEKWGYQLAQVSAGFQILCGLFFIVTWQQLRAASVEVDEAVAVSTFVRVNLDLLIGLVDGAGLALFLYGLRSKERAERSAHRNRRQLATMYPERA
ncbi:MAG: hypothetical protein ACI8P0_003128 [Planctomycetaceae bacterium]